MAGRPRKVVALATGKIGKEKRLNRKRQEEQIKLDREDLVKAPEWLSDFAKEEFYRIVRETEKISLLDNLDKNYLAMYADAYDRYVKATLELQKNGDVLETEKGPVTSPFLNVLTKAAKEMKDASKLLGLAITDRLRLIVPTKTEEKTENKYLKYLKA